MYFGFFNLIIGIKFSIEFEATLLISIVTSHGGPHIKVSFQNIQVGAITIQRAKMGIEPQRKTIKIE
jgi:hypothetical protein